MLHYSNQFNGSIGLKEHVVVIRWPVIIEFAQGHDYVWAADFDEVTEHRLEAGDRLLDSHGHAHVLSHANGAGLYWQHSEGVVSVPQLNIKLQRYAASLGVCCTSKLQVRTPADAIALVAWLEQH